VIARLRKLLTDLGESFWLVPALMVAVGIALAIVLVMADRAGDTPPWIGRSRWLYDGGATGARTLLGAMATATIGVAGTVFSITVAALSLAAGQMGPRLLRNFTRDRGNQAALGTFLGTFSYVMMVLRSIGTGEGNGFVPHLALSFGILLALVCVAMVVYFVGHMSNRINVDTVIELVCADIERAVGRMTTNARQYPPAAARFWDDAVPIADARRGYLQQLDDDGLADWAAAHGAAIRLLARPGHYVYPGAAIAVMTPPVEGAAAAVANATALGAHRVGSADVEFAVRQLVEVAVRALSPGINDPHTAMAVLDRMGAVLCELVPRQLRTGVLMRDDRLALVVPATDYDGLTDVMFHMIRQNAGRNPSVLIHMLDVLTSAVSCEPAPSRVATLERHARLVRDDGERGIATPEDLDDLRARYALFVAVRDKGAVGYLACAPG
jgi:uncharacterized membrane protein